MKKDVTAALVKRIVDVRKAERTARRVSIDGRGSYLESVSHSIANELYALADDLGIGDEVNETVTRTLDEQGII